MSIRDKVRIGGASGFWGDSSLGAPQLVRGGNLDYLVFDYLAEITMSIMARARAKNPELGYATDFVTVIKDLMPEISRQGIKVVSNAGGVNPASCGAALRAAVAELGLDLKVAVVIGDDLLDRTDEFRSAGVTEMFSGSQMPEQLMSANVYLGALPIVAALKAGADIVVTGRNVDSAVTLAPLMYEFDWAEDDYDRLAAGSLAGHIIECGAQATGGNFTDWELSDGWDNMGFPIAECYPDGSFMTTKPEGTGGIIVPGSVGEQMLYEIGDPQAYFLPDVACDFSQVTLEQVGPDQVMVRGALGRAPTNSYKASMTYQDGFRVGLYQTIGGINASAKAAKVADAVFARCRTMYRERNLGDFAETSFEALGAEASYGPHSRIPDAREVVMKIAASHPEKAALDLLVKEATSTATAMAPAIGGLGGNRPKVMPVVKLFSCLISKDMVPVRVEMDDKAIDIAVPVQGGFDPSAIKRPDVPADPDLSGDTVAVPLVALAYGRSGDKGNKSNVAILARKPEYLPYIRAALTEQSVAEFYAHILQGGVDRFDVPGVNALNFLLHDSLAGGGTASLRNDPQGKAHAQMILDYPVTVPLALAQREGLSEAVAAE